VMGITSFLTGHGAAGGSRYTAIQLGKALGATVITTAGSADKLDFCRAQGADYAFNYREQDFAAEVMDITDGRGVDVVYDPVGGDIFEQSVACTASGGRLLAIGFASGRWGTPPMQELVMRNCSVMGAFVGAYSHAEMLPCHQKLLGLYTEGKISLRLDAAISMPELADYLGKLERREVQGKVVVDMWASFSELS
jgi:NADPH2:quinone reductase